MLKFNGAALVAARTAAKMTQRELAERTGLSRQRIISLEDPTGEPAVLFDTLSALAEVLGVPIQNLCEERDTKELTT